VSKLMNPIIKKDLTIISRSSRFTWMLFAYVAVLAVIFFAAIGIISSEYADESTIDVYSGYVYLFPVIGIIQLVIIGILIPIFTASAISGERERQTFDILLTTPVSRMSIAVGKLGSAVIRIMMFVIASVPLMAMSFTVGGLSWGVLFLYLLITFIFACYSGSIGLLCSTLCRKSVSAVVLSYVLYGVVYFMSYLPVVMISYYFSSFQEFVLIANPTYAFMMFFATVLSGEQSGYLFSTGTSSVLYIAISMLVQLAAAALLTFLASRNIKPANR